MAILVNQGRGQRRIRNPQHTFQVKHRPWQIQPMMIAPVLPGETMRNLLLQSRVVTDPVRHPLVGWWLEYYFFYVKHRDLAIRTDTTRMVLEPGYDLKTDHNVTDAVPEHYKYPNTVDWVGHCLQRVVEEYFRFEGEEWDDFLIGGLPAAQIGVQNWMDSIQEGSDYLDITDVEATQAEVTTGSPNHVKASHIEEAMRQYEWLRLNNLTEMSYDQFVATYGVRIQTEELHRPELIRYVRDWTYPTNTIDPDSGEPSSALSWSMRERADKDRFFAEPGFIFGVTIARPKVYFRKQAGAAVGLLTDALSWLPAILNDDPGSSYRRVVSATGPLPSITDANGYMVDVKDIFLYGDQFLNFSPSANQWSDGRENAVELPEGTTAQRRYATDADAYNLFAAPWTTEEEEDPSFPDDYDPPVASQIRQDGIVTCMIAGRQVDHTAAMP